VPLLGRSPFSTPDDAGGRRTHGATVQQELTIAANAAEVWRVVEDPHHLPRWWPGVERMEAVEGDRFTEVYTTRRGKPVRMDFRVIASEPTWRRAWSQELVGTPFERFLAESVTEIALQDVAGGTHVILAQRERLRGYTRTGGFLVVRARRRTLAEALEGLARICAAT
jgi:uncharacterized protein YndB with AHSA1/START domain